MAVNVYRQRGPIRHRVVGRAVGALVAIAVMTMLDDLPMNAGFRLNGKTYINAPWGVEPYPQTAEEYEAYMLRMLNDPIFKARAAANRAAREGLDTKFKTCRRCGTDCFGQEGDADGVFYDWCATCGMNLCGACARDGCCGSVPMESGFERMA